MSGQCKKCGWDGCVCDNDLETTRNHPLMTGQPDNDHSTEVSNMIEEFLYGVGEGSHIDRVPFDKTNHHIENMEINEQNENDGSGLDYLEDEEMLKMDGFNDCIIGIVEQFGRPAIYCYDKDKVIAKLMSEGMDEEEAVDWFCFNQVSAWVGDTTPCFVTLDPTLAEE